MCKKKKTPNNQPKKLKLDTFTLLLERDEKAGSQRNLLLFLPHTQAGLVSLLLLSFREIGTDFQNICTRVFLRSSLSYLPSKCCTFHPANFVAQSFEACQQDRQGVACGEWGGGVFLACVFEGSRRG